MVENEPERTGANAPVRNLFSLFGRSGVFLLSSLTVWVLWAALSMALTGQRLTLSSPHFVTPAILGIGIATGLFLALQWTAGRLLEVTSVLTVIAILATPIYANASAAVGVLLVALSAIALIDLGRPSFSQHDQQPANRKATRSQYSSRQRIFAAGIGGIGFLLAFGSQAASALLAVLLTAVGITLLAWTGPPRWFLIGAGIFVAEMAVVAVIMLGVRESWPSWLSAGDSLSSARHTLWADAISLWRQNPVMGAGPGTFTQSSELATSDPQLAAAHSSVLQVAGELGTIGLILFATIFVAGLSFVTRTSGSCFALRQGHMRGAIAATAWTCLAVHSTIDHLEDFPVVALTAGILLGWAGSQRTLSAPFSGKKLLPRGRSAVSGL